MYARLSLFVLALAACSSDPPPSTVDAATGVDAASIDAASIDGRAIDAPPAAATVVAVACPSSGAPIVVSTSDMFVYTPEMTTISVNGIVNFTMSSNHNVIPDTSLSTDVGLKVDYGDVTCLKFTQAGTFNFYCEPHGFKGAIIVR